MLMPAGVQKLGLLALGILLSAWALLDPHFRNTEQLLSARAGLPLACAAACFILGLAKGSNLGASAGWLAALVIGQAAALQLMQATRHVGYQHYLTPDELNTRTELLSLAVLLLLAGAAIRALIPLFTEIVTWLRTNFRGWQLALLLLAFVFASCAPSLNLYQYGFEILLASFIQLTALLAVVALVRSIPQATVAAIHARLTEWDLLPDGAAAQPAVGIERFAWLAAIWVTGISLLLSVFVYQRHPHIADEVAYLIQAGYLAQGMLTMPLPPVPGAFNIDLMMYQPDRWFSAFPAGWPAILAIGSYLGAPWLINPLLAGISVLLAYSLTRELFSRGAARLMILLMCASPWFLFLAMSYMAHIATLACALAAALAIARLRRSASLLPALIAGIMLGIISLIRPLDGVAAAAILGLWALTGLTSWRDRVRYIPLLVLSAMLVGALVFPYNHYLTGNAASFPVSIYFDELYGAGVNSLGFGANRGLDWRGIDPFPGHGLRDVIVNTQLNTFAINTDLFGWMTGSLLPVFLLLIGGALRGIDYRMLFAILVVTGLYSLYWFNGGPDYAARYWFLILLPVIALSVRGIARTAQRFPARKHAATEIVTGVLALSIAGMLTFMPWRSIDKYFHYNNMRPDIRSLASRHHFSHALVLVNGKRFDDYMSAAVYNTPTLVDGTAIYAWDRDPATRKLLLQSFSDRAVWLVDGPTVTGSGFRIGGGPFTASEMLQQDLPDSGDSLPAGK